LITRKVAKKKELESSWSVDDCEEAHAVLDALDEAESQARES